MYKQQDNNEKAKLLIETFNKKTESLMNRSKLNPRYFLQQLEGSKKQ